MVICDCVDVLICIFFYFRSIRTKFDRRQCSVEDQLPLSIASTVTPVAYRNQAMVIPIRFRFACQVILICLIWYAVSSTGSIVNKIALQEYPYPLSVALASLISIPLYSIPLLRHWRIPRLPLPPGYALRFILPISIGKAVAVGSAYFSLWKVPVSYANTVKATMPLFAVFASRIVLGERQNRQVYCSLIPIMLGVVIASATELSFNLAGLFSALLSTAIYSVLNVFVKRVLKDTDMHPMRLLALNAQIAAIFFFPIWFLWDVVTQNRLPDLRFLAMLLASGFLSFLQNLCAFTLIHKLTALSYAVTNATKRITVISVSLLTLHNPVNGTNMFGMCLAVVGVFLYNRAKQTTKAPSFDLPLTLSDVTLLNMDEKFRQHRRGHLVDNNENYRRSSLEEEEEKANGLSQLSLNSRNERRMDPVFIHHLA